MRLTTKHLDAIMAAARSGDRAKLRRAVRRLAEEAAYDGFQEGAAYIGKSLGRMVRDERADPARLLEILDDEATRTPRYFPDRQAAARKGGGRG